MQAAVDELDGGRADHVDCRAELTSSEGLADAEVCGGAREVGQDDLGLSVR